MITTEEKLLIVKARKLSRTIEAATASLKEVLTELHGDGEAVAIQVDANGEPRWEYKILVELPADFYLTLEMECYCADRGWDKEKIAEQFTAFIYYYDNVRKKPNGKWAHWRKVWYKWVRTTDERETKGNGKSPTRFDRSTIRE